MVNTPTYIDIETKKIVRKKIFLKKTICLLGPGLKKLASAKNFSRGYNI